MSNSQWVKFLEGEVRVADGYVFVCNEAVPNELRARKILLAVDKALDASGLRSVMFDTRDMEAPPEKVNALLRKWVDRCRYHDKVALLVKSDLKRIASNMRALSVGVKLRSFHDMAEAEAWLRKPFVRQRTGTPVEGVPAIPTTRERPRTEPIDMPIRRERTRTEPIDLPAQRGSERKREGDKPEGGKRRWRSPLLQQLNED